jgi:hypothetical protein
MRTSTLFNTRALALCLALSCAAVYAAPHSLAQTNANDKASAQSQGAAATVAATPTEVVRAFYAALREARFKDALMMSVWRPGIESLSASELDELRPDFERLAGQVPPDYEFTGESISGDEATVFMKTGSEKERNVKVEPVYLMRGAGGAWVIGDRAGAVEAKKQGKKFFFEQRIIAHEQDAEDMLKRIQAAQIAYSVQRKGVFGDLNALVDAGFVPKDILGTETTGYHFTVSTGEGAKSYVAHAEPAVYGRTGRLSFYLDASGIQRKDTNGKPLNPSKK